MDLISEGEEVCCLHALFGFSHSYRTITPFTPKTICVGVCVCGGGHRSSFQNIQVSKTVLSPGTSASTYHLAYTDVESEHIKMPKFKIRLSVHTEEEFASTSSRPHKCIPCRCLHLTAVRHRHQLEWTNGHIQCSVQG